MPAKSKAAATARWVAIVVAVIGAAGMIIAALISRPKPTPLRTYPPATGIILTVSDQQISISPGDIQGQARKLIEIASSAPPDTTGPASRAQIKDIAREFGLMESTRANPHLAFLDGDIAYWHEQELSPEQLRLRFAAIRAVLDAAEREHVIIDDQGKLSWAADQILADILKAKTGLSSR